MRFFLRLSLATVMVLAAWATAGRAQPPMGMPPMGMPPGMMGQNAPPVSPYIGMLRTGASPGINWANIVSPELQLFNATNQLQGQQNAMGAGMMSLTNVPTTTGHPIYYGNLMPFYNPRGALAYYMGGMMGMGGMGMGGMGMGGMGMGGMMGGMGGMMGGMGGMGGMMGGMGGMGGMMGGMGGMGYGR